jgi:segregation and condensation protein B
MNLNGNHNPTIEALILSSPEPLPARKIADLIEGMTTRDVDNIIDRLNTSYMNNQSSFRIRQIAGGYQVYITGDYAPIVEELHSKRRSTRLSKAALETLAIIAYRQPVTKMDVEMIRGVSSDSAISTLLEKKLLTLAGRAQSVGRPLLYKTTEGFLKYFNLNTLEDLPRMEEIEELLTGRETEKQPSLPLGPFTSSVPTEITSERIVHLKALGKAEQTVLTENIAPAPATGLTLAPASDEEESPVDETVEAETIEDETVEAENEVDKVLVGETESDSGEEQV